MSKTALNELIEYFNQHELWPKNELWLVKLDEKIGEWKSLEEEQIVEAFVEGKFHGIDCGKQVAKEFITGREYFSKTFSPSNQK